jgi:hypothetical protein
MHFATEVCRLLSKVAMKMHKEEVFLFLIFFHTEGTEDTEFFTRRFKAFKKKLCVLCALCVKKIRLDTKFQTIIRPSNVY